MPLFSIQFSVLKAVFLTLCLLGGWGIWLIIQPRQANQEVTPTAFNQTEYINADQFTVEDHRSKGKQTDVGAQSVKSEIDVLIAGDQVARAVSTINRRYSSLSRADLDSLKRSLIYLAQGQQTASAQKKTLSLSVSVFDDVELWEMLGDVSISDNDWDLAFKAQFRASELQNDTIRLDMLLNKLSISSGHLRKKFQTNDDLIGIKNLYQNLVDQHPSFARFNYELAVAMIDLGELDSASLLLNALSFDPELGEIAGRDLTRVSRLISQRESTYDHNSIATQQGSAKRNLEQSRNSLARNSDINVTLIRVGNSFMVGAALNNQKARLLLDTGASITALSKQLIQRLNLEDTGQSIRLSTANGITSSKLYRLNRLKIGDIELRDMIVAEIQLNNRSNFQGLLGTDALNKSSPEYSYLIDNQNSSLIFRKRS